MKKIQQIIILIIFTLLLTLPALLFNAKATTATVWENRALARLADPKEDGIKATMDSFENYFNDHIGLRTQLITFRKWYSHKLFGIYDYNNYVVNDETDQWFFMDETMKQDYLGISPFTYDYLQEDVAGLHELQDYVEAQGIPFLAIIHPMKYELYEDQFPRDYIRGDGPFLTDIFRDVLRDAGINYICTKDTLMNYDGDEMLFWQCADPVHWSYMGAYIGYVDEINAMNELLGGRLFVPSYEDMNWSRDAYHLDFINGIGEYEYGQTYHPDMAGIEMDKDLPDTIPSNGYEYYHYHNDRPEAAGRILYVGDSFTHLYQLPLLAQSYEDVYFYHWKYRESFLSMMDAVDPDIVIYQFLPGRYAPGEPMSYGWFDEAGGGE